MSQTNTEVLKYPKSASRSLEDAILKAVGRGEIFSFDVWASNRGISADRRSSESFIDANFLRDLCIERHLEARESDHTYAVHPIGVRVKGLFVLGDINLNDHAISKPIAFDKCCVDGHIRLRDATTKGIRFFHTQMKSLNANGASIDGRCRLEGIFTSFGADLRHARINGELNCCNAVVRNWHTLSHEEPLHDNAGNGRDYSAPSTTGLDATGIRINGDCRMNGLRTSGRTGVSLNGAEISGDLIAKDAKLYGGLDTKTINFPGEITEQTPSSFSADRLTVKGRVNFNNTTFSGWRAIRLGGAKIGGHTDFRQIFAFSHGNGFAADGTLFSGNLKLGGRIVSSTKDAIRLRHSKVSGNLSLGHRGRFLTGPGKPPADTGFGDFEETKGTTEVETTETMIEVVGGEYALIADGIHVSGRLMVRGNLKADNFDALRLHGATLVGPLVLRDAVLKSRLDGLAAERCKFRSFLQLYAVDIRSGVRAVSLSDTKVGGGFTCSRTSLSGGDDALRQGWDIEFAAGVRADRLRVAGEVVIEDCEEISGPEAFRARGAQFESSVSFRGSHLTQSKDSQNPTEAYREYTALDLSHAEIKAALFLDGKEKITGRTQQDARIRKNIRSNFLPRIHGHIRLDRAAVDTLVDNWGTWFEKPSLTDTLENNWQRKNHGDLVLDGFTYNHLRNVVGKEFRKRFLHLQPDNHLETSFRPHPWEQVALVLRSMGHPEWAKEILVAKHDRLRTKTRKDLLSSFGITRADAKSAPSVEEQNTETNTDGIFTKFFTQSILNQTVKYGLRPFHALRWLLAIYVFTWGVFLGAEKLHLMSPSQAAANVYAISAVKDLLHADQQATTLVSGDLKAPLASDESEKVLSVASKTHIGPSYADLVVPGYPRFSAPIYAADLIIPLVDLHQEDFWEPAAPLCSSIPGYQLDSTKPPNNLCVPETTTILGFPVSMESLRSVVKTWRTIAIFAGWLLVSFLVAGLTGLTRSS